MPRIPLIDKTEDPFETFERMERKIENLEAEVTEIKTEPSTEDKVRQIEAEIAKTRRS